ncbi:MAG: hypothetical protein CMG91_02445 [Marinobacter sp.]|nr:hypothetical protein [Marinobacter sp.]|tara:strand:- start:879 stop:1175 length:297 start_codon:yes stop_codon:yes gene_type:complete
MGAVIDLSQYQSHFQGTEDQELAALESYKPSFLAPGTEYPDLKWMIKDAPKDGKGISFSVPIAPNFLLSEDSALVEIREARSFNHGNEFGQNNRESWA